MIDITNMSNKTLVQEQYKKQIKSLQIKNCAEKREA